MRRLAKEHDFLVVGIGRDPARIAATRREMEKRGLGDRVHFELAELSRVDAIRALADRMEGPLHVLINNASATPRRHEISAEGLEMQYAVNILGYFRMTEAFAPALELGAPSRVVNVASYWAGGLDLSDLQFERRRYDNDDAYRQSKQAERMLTVHFAGQLARKGITVNACHPGDVNSRLSNSLGFGGHESPDEGAETPVWLASSRDVDGVSGAYFERRRAVRCRFGEDATGVERLAEICAGFGEAG